MSYVTTNGWVDDMTGAIKNVVANAPTHVNQALSTGKQILTAAQKAPSTIANVQKAAAGGAKAAQDLQAMQQKWEKAKPFVYIGGAVLLFLVVKKLV